jgi:lipopolysaccharide export system protein LptA
MQEKNMCHLKKYLLVFSMGFSLVSFALPEDQQQPLHITANSTQFNYKTGKNIYEGNVIIDQGTTHLTADRVITQNNERHKIAEAIAFGIKQQAFYTTVPKQGDSLFSAKANVIKFYPPKFTIILDGNASVIQGENSFHGPLILYNTKDQIVTAPPSGKGSATLIIKPG